jgi:hypothetical protein
MANLHSVFTEYNSIVRLSDPKREMLIIVRDNLRSRIQKRHVQFAEINKPFDLLEFQSQGSFVMDTIITPVHDDYDLDDGIYFIGRLSPERRPEPEVFHKMIIEAIGANYDDVEKVIDKATCVRVIYKSGFHIDLPIYYADNKECPDLADKVRKWILSNPVEFIAWFEEKTRSGFQKAFLYESALYDKYERWLTDIRKQDVQLRRLVRYLKAWGDLRREEMPCGLVMTILVANNHYEHERDDIALKETLVLIEAALRKSFNCERPTTPVGEDLLASYKNKDAFLNYLRQFIENAKQALLENDPQKACKHWQKSLGDRFPCHFAPSQSKVTTASTSALAAGASSSRPWGIQYEHGI